MPAIALPDRLRPGRVARALLIALLVLPGVLQAQQPPTHADILRGRVVSDSGLAVGGADVVVTMAPDRSERATRTDSLGRYELRIAGGTGDYLVHVTGLGWQPWRKRVTRTGTDSILTVDVTLKAQAVALAPVTATAERPKPDPSDRPKNVEPGGRETFADGVYAAVPPSLQGDVNAIAATIPGVNAVPGGVSVLGLPPGQNMVTLNGMAFAAGDLPREARTSTRVSSSSFDPARGGFAGAQLGMDLGPGGIFSSRRAHLTLDAPQLQYGDAISMRSGQRYTAFQASAGGDGELVRDRFYYNVAGQLSRRAEDATTLLNAGSDVLQPAGVAPDSVARFLQLLSAQGAPTRIGSSLSDSRLSTAGSFVARLDRIPLDRRKSWAVTAFGKATSADAAFSPLATGTHGGSNRSAGAGVQGESAVYFYRNYLNLARTGLSFSSTRMEPALRLPDGRVLVGSGAGDGFASLAFGGNGLLDSDVRSWTWETSDELQWYNRTSRHKFKLFADSRLDGYRQTTLSNPFGSYGYSSLADLAANRPASYSRVLSAPRATGGEWSGVFAAGDQVRVGRLALVYGARLEANHFTQTPAANPDVLSIFGARTDVAPNTFHASPRVGFSYALTKQSGGGGVASNPVATRILVPRGLIRGGIGEFRSFLPPTLLADAMVSNGLSGAMRRLDCVGPAVPLPDWSALAAGAAPPSTCADGSPVFADASPAVRLFDPSYDAARSWRANLGWSGTALGLAVTLDGAYSLNLDQPGAVDLNFAGTPKFTLGDEARPVFVSPSAIVPQTGIASPVETRRSAAFARVLSQRSDLRGFGRQITVTVAPGISGISSVFFSGAYTLAQSQWQFRGFDGGAFGDPGLRENAPGDYDIRHQLQIQAGRSFADWLSGSFFATLSSGRPFTPIVAGDVNGDGVSGDRAFVFDPAHAADPALAAGMRSLLASAPGGVRGCLERQLGRAAERNSCRGPWTADLRAQIAFGSRYQSRPHNRLSGTLNFANPLGGLDQLLHGSGGLHGWGTTAFPDPVLYNVRGFDASAQRFRYEVNPRFGNTRPSATTIRAPFRVTLDITIDLGKSTGQQQLERSLAPGHRMSATAMNRMYARNVLDVYRSILEQSDSLMLTPDQTRALQEAQARYRTRMDSLWNDLTTYLAALPAHYDGRAALQRQETTIDAAWAIDWKEGPTIHAILTPLQVRMIEFVSWIINSKTAPHVRMYMFD